MVDFSLRQVIIMMNILTRLFYLDCLIYIILVDVQTNKNYWF